MTRPGGLPPVGDGSGTIRDEVRRLASRGPLPAESGLDAASIDSLDEDIRANTPPISEAELDLLIPLLEGPEDDHIFGVLQSLDSLLETCRPLGWQARLNVTDHPRMWRLRTRWEAFRRSASMWPEGSLNSADFDGPPRVPFTSHAVPDWVAFAASHALDDLNPERAATQLRPQVAALLNWGPLQPGTASTYWTDERLRQRASLIDDVPSPLTGPERDALADLLCAGPEHDSVLRCGTGAGWSFSITGVQTAATHRHPYAFWTAVMENGQRATVPVIPTTVSPPTQTSLPTRST